MRTPFVATAILAACCAAAAQEPVPSFDPGVAVARAWDLLEPYLEQRSGSEQASAVAALAGTGVPRAVERLVQRGVREGPHRIAWRALVAAGGQQDDRLLREGLADRDAGIRVMSL